MISNSPGTPERPAEMRNRGAARGVLHEVAEGPIPSESTQRIRHNTYPVAFYR